MTGVLIDSSAWISFFRGERDAVSRIDPLLADGMAAICGPVFAEVVSGATTPSAQNSLASLFEGLLWSAEPNRVWQRAAELRFSLARSGCQVQILDLWIALSALDSRFRLLTRDQDFVPISRLLPLDLSVF